MTVPGPTRVSSIPSLAVVMSFSRCGEHHLRSRDLKFLFGQAATIAPNCRHAPAAGYLRPLRDQIQFQLAETVVIPANPLMQLGRGVPLLPQIVGEGKGLAVDIGLQEDRQRADAHDAAI